MTTPTCAPKATRREWIGLAAIALPCFVYAMDMTVLNLALPAISSALAPSASQLLWIVDIYGFLVAGFLITMGTLGDRFGRRRLLLIGAAAFGAASVAAAFADSTEMLIAMRALLGVAGATLAPSTMSLIRNMFHDAHQRQFAIGVWIASFSAGGAVGPLVGGVLLEFFWWGSVFLVAVPVMALLLVVGPRLLPEYRDPDAGRIDLPSVALSLGAVLATIYGLKRMAEHGFGWLALAGVLGGLAFGTAFLRRQRRIDYPLLDLDLFRRPAFTAAFAAYGLSCLAMFGVYLYIAQYLQLVLGLSPLLAGLATVPWSLAFAVGSLLAPRLARRAAPVSIFVGGLARLGARLRPAGVRLGQRRGAGGGGGEHGPDEPRHGAGLYRRQRDDHHLGAARACRRRVGAVGDGVRVQCRVGRGGLRQHRHAALPAGTGRFDARRDPGRPGRGGAGHPRQRRRGRGCDGRAGRRGAAVGLACGIRRCDAGRRRRRRGADAGRQCPVGMDPRHRRRIAPRPGCHTRRGVASMDRHIGRVGRHVE